MSRYLLSPKCSLILSNFGHQVGAQLLFSAYRSRQSCVTSIDIISLSLNLEKLGSVFLLERRDLIPGISGSLDCRYLVSAITSIQHGGLQSARRGTLSWLGTRCAALLPRRVLSCFVLYVYAKSIGSMMHCVPLFFSRIGFITHQS